jgi:hypothetical protein
MEGILTVSGMEGILTVSDRDRVEQCRKNIADTIHGSIEQYAAVLGLQPNAQFQQDLNQAFFLCVLMHWDSPKPKNNSGVRKELRRVEKEAAAAAKCLRRLQVALENLTPSYRDAIVKNVEVPFRTALKLGGLSGWANIYATQLTRKGGAPKMLAFDTLIKWLARAYQNATGRAAKVTWNEHDNCYQGRFVSLVEAVLPVVCALAGTTPPMRCPQSAGARGKFIYDATTSIETRRTSHMSPALAAPGLALWSAAIQTCSGHFATRPIDRLNWTHSAPPWRRRGRPRQGGLAAGSDVGGPPASASRRAMKRWMDSTVIRRARPSRNESSSREFKSWYSRSLPHVSILRAARGRTRSCKSVMSVRELGIYRSRLPKQDGER